MSSKGWLAVNVTTGKDVSKLETYANAFKLVENLNNIRIHNNKDPIYKLMSLQDYEHWKRERYKTPETD